MDTTPRPWRVDHSIEVEPLSGRPPQHHWTLFSNVPGPNFHAGQATSEVNAELIVTAVNAYDHLLSENAYLRETLRDIGNRALTHDLRALVDAALKGA